MNREQKPRSADLSGDSVAGSPASGDEVGGPRVSDDAEAALEAKDDSKDKAPPWAAPLRDMYQQVVEEPLPDFLSDLLSRLDRDDE